jgi:hypothetical protein
VSKEHEKAKQAGWTGDLNDNCYLWRYGMTASVEKMDEGVWWFGVSTPRDSGVGYWRRFNSADMESHLPLTSAEKARCAAECVMECLRLLDEGVYE